MIVRAGITGRALALLAALVAGSGPAAAEIDGHGPDAWRVTGIAADDVLNIRMGPGTQYPVIASFGPQERGLEEITCVPFMTLAIHSRLTAAELQALPPRWCLMRDATMTKAGWVSARYLTPDEGGGGRAAALDAPTPSLPVAGDTGDLVADATALVQALYTAHLRAFGVADSPVWNREAGQYFTAGLIDSFAAAGADPLLGAQDFNGRLVEIAADPQPPQQRGVVTIVVDYLNFGEPGQARLFLRGDDSQPGAPLRIFRIEHAGWALP